MGWFISWKTLLKWMIWGVPLFLETPNSKGPIVFFFPGWFLSVLPWEMGPQTFEHIHTKGAEWISSHEYNGDVCFILKKRWISFFQSFTLVYWSYLMVRSELQKFVGNPMEFNNHVLDGFIPCVMNLQLLNRNYITLVFQAILQSYRSWVHRSLEPLKAFSSGGVKGGH